MSRPILVVETRSNFSKTRLEEFEARELHIKGPDMIIITDDQQQHTLGKQIKGLCTVRKWIVF